MNPSITLNDRKEGQRIKLIHGLMSVFSEILSVIWDFETIIKNLKGWCMIPEKPKCSYKTHQESKGQNYE